MAPAANAAMKGFLSSFILSFLSILLEGCFRQDHRPGRDESENHQHRHPSSAAGGKRFGIEGGWGDNREVSAARARRRQKRSVGGEKGHEVGRMFLNVITPGEHLVRFRVRHR